MSVIILYTPLPEEIVLSSPEALGISDPAKHEIRETLREIRLPRGGKLIVQDLEANQSKIIRLVSTDPMDYLRTDWQPGATVSQ